MNILPFFTFLRSPVYIVTAFFACLLLAHCHMDCRQRSVLCVSRISVVFL